MKILIQKKKHLITYEDDAQNIRELEQKIAFMEKKITWTELISKLSLVCVISSKRLSI